MLGSVKIINIIPLLVDKRGGAAPCGWDSGEVVADLSASPQTQPEPSIPSSFPPLLGDTGHEVHLCCKSPCASDFMSPS